MAGTQKPTSERRARPPRRPRLAGRAALALVATLLVAEGLARVLGSHLPPLLTGDDIEMELKAARIDQLAAGPVAQQPQVVVFGNSMLDAGLSPEVFTAASADWDRAYNAALIGAPVTSQARWAEQHVLDGLDPGLVVLGVSPLDLLDVNPLDLLDVGRGEGRSQTVEAAFDASLDRLDPTPLQRLQAWADDTSYLVRHRASLRTPRALGRAIGDTVTGAPAREGIPQKATVQGGQVVDRDRAFWEGAIRPTGGTSQFHERRLDQSRDPDLEGRIASAVVSADYRPERLRTLLEAVQAEGRRVVVVAPPLAVSTMSAEPGARQRLAEGIELMRSVAEPFGAEVLDFTSRPFPLEMFADVSHLNGPGADRFSRALALALDEAG